MTTWLEDASANRHIKTYVKDFLDVSGNLSVRQKENRESYYDQLGQTIRTHYRNSNLFLGKNVCMDASGINIAVSVQNDSVTYGSSSASNDYLGIATSGNSETKNGLVYAYTYDASSQLWLQRGQPLATPDRFDGYNFDRFFGIAMEMSADGNVLLVGDSHYQTNKGVGWRFSYDSSSNRWLNDGIFFDNGVANNYYGYVGMALSGDGNTVAMARYSNNRHTRIWRNVGPDVNGDLVWVIIGQDTRGSFPSLSYDGNRFVSYDKDNNNTRTYEYSGTPTASTNDTNLNNWSQVGTNINHSSNTSDDFNTCTGMNAQGNIIAVSGEGDDVVYVYKYDDATSDWVQYGSALEGFLISNDPGARDSSSRSLRLNAAGDHIMFGQIAQSTIHQMRIYKYCDTTNDWGHLISLPAKTPTQQNILWRNMTQSSYMYNTSFGSAMACSDDMSRFIVGAPYSWPSNNGSAYVYQRYDPVQTYDTVLDISNGVVDFPQLHREYKPNDVLPSPYTLDRFQYIRRPETENRFFGWTSATNRDGSMFVTSTRLSSMSGGTNSGSVHVYKLVDGAYVTIGQPIYGTDQTELGIHLDMDDSGHRILIGQSRNEANQSFAGRLTVYDLSGTTWVKVGSAINGDAANDAFGYYGGLSISGNGRVIAGQSQSDNYVRSYEYVDASGDWVARPQLQQQYVRNANSWSPSCKLNYDGSIIAWGDPYDDAAGTDQGRVYVYKYTGDIRDGSYNLLGLSQGFRNMHHAYDGITFYDSGGSSNEQWGRLISLSDDGYTMALASPYWSSNQGKVVVMRYSEVNDEWIYLGSPINRERATPQGSTYWGRSIQLSADGETIAIGDYGADYGGSNAGGVYVFKYLQGDWHCVASYFETAQTEVYIGEQNMSMSKDASTIVTGSYRMDNSNLTDNGQVVVLKLNDKNHYGDGGNRYKSGLKFQDAKNTIITNDEVITKSMILRNRDDSNRFHFNSDGGYGGQPVYASSTRSFQNINGAELFTSTINATQAGCNSTEKSGIGFHWLQKTGYTVQSFRIDGTGLASFCGPSYNSGLSGVYKHAIVASTTQIQNYTNNTISTKLFSHRLGIVVGTIRAHTGNFSDRRIKKNIQTIDDASSLEKIRLLNPCTYDYIDKITRGNHTVEGFIAQEVAQVLPYAVSVGYGEIPNIYKMASCDKDSNGNQIITIPDYDTANLKLDASGNMCSKLLIYNKVNEPTDITITSVLSSTSLQVESTYPIPNEVFIYGQYIDDRHELDKARIFTVMTSALQEVDRQLQAERAKTATLETELASLLADVIALEAA